MSFTTKKVLKIKKNFTTCLMLQVNIRSQK